MVSPLLVLFLCSCIYVGVYISSIVGIVCVCECVTFVYVCMYFPVVWLVQCDPVRVSCLGACIQFCLVLYVCVCTIHSSYYILFSIIL